VSTVQPTLDHKPRRWLRVLILVFVLLLVAASAWARWVVVQINRYARMDEAAPADAIVVFGAAEYAGKPSPVYRARLNHAKDLFDRGLAPLVITMGGDGGDRYSEGGVGRDYLMGEGVPESALIAETHSYSTSQSSRRLAVIARANGLHRLIVVSDATHLFRIHAICSADGLDVLTSPRATVITTDSSPRDEAVLHEIVSYTLWRLHLD
jgi:vancomycin permeability regulator SanA